MGDNISALWVDDKDVKEMGITFQHITIAFSLCTTHCGNNN